ncbi:MAG TPA: glycosyltransferase family 1 protein [Bryobacteraceae bacterium]|nr:glycosyltransferase family 1 protein [Bryobacteraceae bacterium]
MRISIDATPLLLRSAGVKNYIHHWLEHLRREAGRDAIGTFPVFAGFGTLDHEHSMAGRLPTLAGLALLHGLNLSRVPWILPGVDLFHAGHQCHNPPRNCRVTTTIHDMTCWLMPELHNSRNVQGTLAFGEQVMKRADGIIAVSENTRRDAIDILDLEPDQVVTIYPGVAESFFDVTAADVHSVREKHGLSRPYVLFVGTIEPRKNVPGLLNAYAQLTASTREQYEMVLAGPVGWADRETLAKVAHAEGVRYLGYVPEGDLPGITAGASVLAYPSFYEGFGFPVAQAMAAGVPVITSDRSSLPEIAGEGALLIDPESTEEIRAALERLLTSPGLRERLGGAGRCRARGFRWELSARKSLEWFRRVAG